jgi:hypothetical protein
VGAAFKAIHMITTVGIINDVEYVCEASQNLLRQVQMMNKARGHYIDPSTGDFVRASNPISARESTNQHYLGSSGSSGGINRSQQQGIGQHAGGMNRHIMAQSSRLYMDNQSTLNDGQQRFQQNSNFPEVGLGGGGSYDAYYGSEMPISYKSNQQQQFRQTYDESGTQSNYFQDKQINHSDHTGYSNYPISIPVTNTTPSQSQSGISGFAGNREIRSDPIVSSADTNQSVADSFQGLSAGQFLRPSVTTGSSQMRSMSATFPSAMYGTSHYSSAASLSLDASTHSNPSPPSLGYSDYSSHTISESPPSSFSSKAKQAVDLSAFGLEPSSQGTSCTSLQVDISSYMSSLKLTDSGSIDQKQSPPVPVPVQSTGNARHPISSSLLGVAPVNSHAAAPSSSARAGNFHVEGSQFN